MATLKNRIVLRGGVIIGVSLVCFSCFYKDWQTNGTLLCNVLEVSQKGIIQKHANERVAFSFKNDTLRIRSFHFTVNIARKRSAERKIKAIKTARTQFIFADSHNELYAVYYSQKRLPHKLYLYLYIINIKHVKPAYLFTNDPNYAM